MRAAAVLIALLALGGLASARQPKERRGKVVYATAQRAYLDKGKFDGLRAGDIVKMLQGKSSGATCTIEIAGDHTASCAIAGARSGDAFIFEVTAEVGAGTPVKPLPAIVSEADRARGSAEVAHTPYAKVDGDRPESGGVRGVPLVEASIGHASWMTFSGNSFHEERVDLSLAGADLNWAGFRAFARLTAIQWTSRPASTRFRPSQDTQVNVWEAELASREVGRPFALAFGRVWPWGIPGLAALDGAQVGWRSQSGATEAGVFGGGLPDPITLEPAFDRWIAGAYASGTVVPADSLLRLLRYEGRVATRNVPNLGNKTDMELLGQAWITRWLDAGAETRIALRGADGSGPSIEALRFNTSARALDKLRVDAGLRYLSRKTIDDDGLGLDPFGEAGWVVAEGDMTWNAASWLTLSVIGGAAQDDASSRDREFIGPELGLPRLLGRFGGLSLGYLEERGWDEGRSTWAQLALQPVERMRLILRASYFEDRFALATGSNTVREIGAFADAEARLRRWLLIRGFAVARVAVDGVGAGGEGGAGRPAGVDFAIDLAGQL